jgi:transcription initiation factor TFIIH subunit 2
MTLIVDFSAASQKQDLRPNRSVITKAFLQDFIKEFIE